MNREPRPIITHVLALGCLLATAATLAAGSFSQPGSYRPVEGQGGSMAQGQFPPTENRGNAQRWNTTPQPLPSPTLPSQPQPSAAGGYYYAPPGYGTSTWPQPAYAAPAPQYDNRNWAPPIPNPTSVLDNFFGSNHRNEPATTYLPPPVPPIAPPVAPVYNPPVPAVPQTWSNVYPTQPTYQPQAAYPSQPAYQPQTNYQAQQPLQATQQPGYRSPQNPPANSYSPPAQRQQPVSQPPAVTQAPASTAPRPFSNPQESGSSFVLRTSPQAGRNDPRFRPPELEGTP